MQWIPRWIAMPSPGHLVVSDYLLLVTVFVQLAFTGFVVGSAFWSVFFSVVGRFWPEERYPALARQLIAMAAASPLNLVLFSLVPLIAMPLLYGQILYPATENTGPERTTGMLLMAIPMVAAGLVLVYLYGKMCRLRQTSFAARVLPGLLALALLLGGCHFITGAITIALDPERWPYVTDLRGRLMFSWNEIARFKHFMVVSFALAGAGLLLARAATGDDDLHGDPDYARFRRSFGGGLALACCLILPLMNFWNTVTLQYQAVSPAFYATICIATVMLALAAVALLKALLDPARRPTALPLASILLFLFVFNVADAVARTNALSDERNALMVKAEAAVQAEDSAKQEKYGVYEPEAAAGGGEGGASQGQSLAQSKGCASCHSVDGTRLAGPTWKGLYGHKVAVATGGTERTVTADEAYITRSIREPNADVVKGFAPVMPVQAVSDGEIKALIEYIKGLK